MTRGGFAAALVFAIAMIAAPSAAQQQPASDVESAKHAFEDGVALEKKSDYVSALAKFRESAQIKPTLGNRFHIAYCLEMTGHLASALAEYEALDKSAHEQNKPELIEATRVRLESLRPRVPHLTLRIVPPPPKEGIAGLEVLIDGKPKSLIDAADTVDVDPGERIVTAHAPDHESFSKKLMIEEATTTSVDVFLPQRNIAPPPTKPAAAAARDAPSSSSDPQSTRDSTTRMYAIAGTAGAVGVTTIGIVSFVVAGSTASDARATCPSKITCSSEQNKVRTFDAIALGGFIGGAGLTALSVVLWLRASHASRSSSSPSTAVVVRPSWAGIEGRF